MFRNLCMMFVAVVIGASASTSHAVLIHEWNFDDNTANDSVGSANLSVVGATPLITNSYRSDGDENNYLQVVGPGGQPDFTLSVWVKTDVGNQGTFKGIFSNNTSSGADFSFQFDSNNGSYRLVSSEGSAQTFGTASTGTWENLIIQKFGGNNARLYLNGALVGTTGYNPGGLQNFRLGINRNSDNSFLGWIDNVQVWDDSSQDAAAIFAAGPGSTVPEPTTAVLGLLGMAGLAMRRRHA